MNYFSNFAAHRKSDRRRAMKLAANWTLATVRDVERPREDARTGLPSVSAACRSINCSKANQPGRWDLRNGESSNLGRNIRGEKSKGDL